MIERDAYNSISPIDYRYWDREAAIYLSENGATRYKLRVEAVLARVLCQRGLCSTKIANEIQSACDRVTTAEVYEEEARIKHDIRALVNCIASKVSKVDCFVKTANLNLIDIIDEALILAG